MFVCLFSDPKPREPRPPGDVSGAMYPTLSLILTKHEQFTKLVCYVNGHSTSRHTDLFTSRLCISYRQYVHKHCYRHY
jgi:hypothetical protein